MAEVIRMPKMSDTMTEGVIAAWHKKVGDTIKTGDVLADVETDKATMELEAYEEGVLLHIGIPAGKSVPVDGIMAVIGKKGEDFEHLLQDKKENTATPVAQNGVATTATKTESPKPQETAIDTSNIKATAIRMPKMSDTMTEGVIVAWHKKVGDAVKSGDLLAEVETDKAVMELEAYEEGTLLYIGIQAGSAVPVDGIIAIVGEKGANYEALLNTKNTNTVASNATSSKSKVEEPVAPNSQETVAEEMHTERIKISPLAKKIAQDKGYNLQQIKGTGDNGRIIKKDVETFQPSKSTNGQANKVEKASTNSTPNVAGVESFEEVNVSQMRKAIARRLAESKFTAPHFYLTIEINMDKAMEARKSINEIASSKVSFNDLMIKATAMALRKHPKVNSSWLGDKIRYNHHVHIGVAVAVEEGLLVPVVRFADTKSMSTIATEVKELGQKAKNKLLQPADWEGNTFTISNLGMFGIEEFTAIINPPDACILAVGGIKETVIVKDGKMQIGNVMKATLSCDHRVVDGAIGSAFLQTLKSLVEDPIRLLA